MTLIQSILHYFERRRAAARCKTTLQLIPNLKRQRSPLKKAKLTHPVLNFYGQGLAFVSVENIDHHSFKVRKEGTLKCINTSFIELCSISIAPAKKKRQLAVTSAAAETNEASVANKFYYFFLLACR